ncbi:MAG: DUF433 domain-containing protein [Candidatus Nanopelagicales bacterium]
MEVTGPSSQRSFRLSARTCALLDDLAAASSETRNSLVERLLGEALRLERHPLIRFRTGAAGRREPFVVGTRLLVRQVVASFHDGGKDVSAVSEYLAVPEREIRAALAYYADFAADVDRDAEWAARVESGERARWDREQAALA